MTFSSEEWPKGKLQTVWIWNPGKFPSICTGVLKMYNFGQIPSVILVDWAVFRTFLDFTKMGTRWNLESMFLKTVHQKGLFEAIKENKKKSFAFLHVAIIGLFLWTSADSSLWLIVSEMRSWAWHKFGRRASSNVHLSLKTSEHSQSNLYKPCSMFTLHVSRHICWYVSREAHWETNFFQKAAGPIEWRFWSNDMTSDPMTWNIYPVEWRSIQ